MKAKKATYLTIRCQNRTTHLHKGKPREGNIVAFLGKRSITVRCSDANCRHWSRLEFNFPGLEGLDFQKAGIVQRSIGPGTMELETAKAAVVIESDQ